MKTLSTAVEMFQKDIISSFYGDIEPIYAINGADLARGYKKTTRRLTELLFI